MKLYLLLSPVATNYSMLLQFNDIKSHPSTYLSKKILYPFPVEQCFHYNHPLLCNHSNFSHYTLDKLAVYCLLIQVSAIKVRIDQAFVASHIVVVLP